jgi:hypothetical protein
MSMLRNLLGVVAAVALAPAAHAAVVWSEAVNGDLSADRLNPTFIAVANGSNQIVGATGDIGAGTDLDYFRITVPTGSVLSSIVVMPITAPDSVAFIGIEAGNQITTTNSPAPLLGWLHYGAFHANSDILPLIGQGGGSIGFTPPLPAGNYAFWIQDFDAGLSPYGFDLRVSAVPEPASALLLLAGGALVAGARRRSQVLVEERRRAEAAGRP